MNAVSPDEIDLNLRAKAFTIISSHSLKTHSDLISNDASVDSLVMRIELNFKPAHLVWQQYHHLIPLGLHISLSNGQLA